MFFLINMQYIDLIGFVLFKQSFVIFK